MAKAKAGGAEASEKAKALPPKQRRVYSLLVKGKKPDQIAKTLKISVNGVYGHMRRIEEHGIDVSKYRVNGSRSSNGRSRNGTGKRGSRRGKHPDPVVQSTLDILTGQETTLQAEFDRVQAEANKRLKEIGAVQAEVTQTKRRIESKA